MATTERDYYDVLGVERTATDAEIKRAYRKLAQQWHPDVNHDPAAHERFTEINEAYQVLSDPDRRGRYDMFGRAGVGGGGARPGSTAFGGFSDIFDAFFGGGAAAAGGARRGRPPPGADLRYDLRITFEEAVKGTEKEIEFPVLLPLRHVPRQRRQARHRADDLPAVQRAGRGPLDPPDDARPDGQRQRLPALRRRGPDRRDAVRDLPRRGPDRAATDPAGHDPGRASTRATRSACRTRARSGRAAAPPGSLYVAVHVQPHPSLQARRDRALLRGAGLDRPGGARDQDHGPDRRRRRGGRDQGRAPSRPPRSGCAARACRTSGGGARGDLHVLVDVVVPTRLSSARASCWRRTPRSPASPSRPGTAASARSSGSVERGPARGSGPATDPTGASPEVGAGAWLELAVEADVEAVEAVSEILGRAAPGGTSVEPAFELVDEGLGARVDPTRPATVRAYLPARDRAAAERAAAAVAEALGHLQAFGLRPIGELRTRLVHEADWAEAWKAYFPVLRVGRRLVIRPTWRRHRRRAGRRGAGARSRAWPSGPGCIRRRGCAWRRSRGWRITGRDRRRDACSTSAAAPGSWRSRPCKLGAASALGLDTDPIAIEATLANARRNAVARRLRARQGSLPSADAAVRRRPRQPDRRRPGAPRAACCATSCRPGGVAAGLGDLRRPGGRGPDGVRSGRASPSSSAAAEGDWVALGGRDAAADRPAPPAEPIRGAVALQSRPCRGSSRSCWSRTSRWR